MKVFSTVCHEVAAGLRLRRPVWWLRFGSNERQWIGRAAAAMPVIVMVGIFSWQRQAASAVTLKEAIAAAEQSLAQKRVSQAALVEPEEPSPWWSKIPAAIDAHELAAVERVIADAMASADKLGVKVVRLSTSRQRTEAAAPYRRTVMQVEVTGGYADIKRWLSELLGRRPYALALRSLDVRRRNGVEGGGATGGVEATVELRLFEREAVDRVQETNPERS